MLLMRVHLTKNTALTLTKSITRLRLLTGPYQQKPDWDYAETIPIKQAIEVWLPLSPFR